jgi:3-dehydroquinate synthase
VSARKRRRALPLHRPEDPYPVLLGEGLLDDLGALLRRLWGRRSLAIVTQARLVRLHGERLEGSLRRAGLSAAILPILEGEERKTLATVSRLYDGLVARSFTREDGIVAFGGGMVGDTAGFVAATFLRGIPYVQVPTTLLAQIDSSIGSKVGVNHPRGKNLIGAIYRPRGVFLDPALLATLPEREFRSGLFELLKYGFIGRPGLLRRLEAKPTTVGDAELLESIAEAVRRKLEVVGKDEEERGLRRILNFGHTIGHGLEAAGDYRKLTHGEAVGWGMIGAIRIARRRGRLAPALAARLERVVRRVGPLPDLGSLPARRVLDAVSRDKKIGKSGLRFILPVALGRVEVVEGFPTDEVAWAVGSLGVGRRVR